MRCAAALSTEPDPDAAASEVLGSMARGLGGDSADLSLLFASEHHAGVLQTIGRAMLERGLARHVLGCTGESIVGGNREIEGGPALSAWAIGLPGVALRPLRLSF